MRTLLQQFEECLRGRICFMGLGNTDYGDDGLGVRLAEKLIDAGTPNVIVAGTVPDRWIGLTDGFDHLLFLDAVEFGGSPGDVVFLDSADITTRFPQISTHKMSLGLLAQWIQASGKTKTWLLGVQPESLQTAQLSSAVQNTLDALCALLKGIAHGETAVLGCPHEGLASYPLGRSNHA